MKAKFLLYLAAVVAVLVVAPRRASGCEDCFFNNQNIATCRPTFDGEMGNTICWSITTDCQFDGAACTIITVGGGGSGGGGGGGGGCSGGAGGCPAECFSCSGGGGRPRI